MGFLKKAMNKARKQAGLPPVPTDLPFQHQAFFGAIRENLAVRMGQEGDPLEKAVTFKDLGDTGMVSYSRTGGAPRLTPPPTTDPIDYSPPPAITNLAANGGFDIIFLTWDSLVLSYNYYVEVWRSPVDALDLASADMKLIGTANAPQYVDNLNGDTTTYYYWVRIVKAIGSQLIYGPFNQTAGTPGQITLDPAYVIDVIQGQVNESTLAANLTSRVNLIDAPTTGLVDRMGVNEARIVDIKNVVQNDGTTLAQKFTEIQSSANAVFSQPNEPAAVDSTEGDLWIDTDDANRLRTYVNGVWVDAMVGGVETALQAAAAAQETADGKIQSFWQAAEPTNNTANDLGVGDIWFDTDDQNKPYRWNGTIWEDARDSKIADAIDAASDAQSTADGKVTTFYQPTPPVAEGDGDLWVDTDDENHLWRWDATASQWVNIRDGAVQRALDAAAASQAAADGEIVAYYQTTAPDGATVEVGDLWFDTDANNAPFRWDGSAWVDASNNAVAKALYDLIQVQATVDGKAKTFFQPTAPTAEGDGDLWVDTDDGNILHRWNAQSGQWDEVRDFGISVGLGKTKAFYQTTEPQAENVNDLWFDTDDGDKAYLWDGLNWNPMGLATVAAVDATVTDNNVTMIGYCEIAGVPASQHVTPADCSAAGGTWVPASPLAESVKQVSVTDGNQVAALEQMFQAHGSDIGDLKLQYTLKLDNDGYVSGLGLFNDGNTSEFIVASDAVYFIDPGQSIQPFDPNFNYPSLDDARDTQLVFGYANVEGMKRFVINVPAYIPDASITTAQISNATITQAQIVDLSVAAADLTAANIWEYAGIGGVIQSIPFTTGSTGWRLTQDGNFEANNATVRGRIEADTGYISQNLQIGGTSQDIGDVLQMAQDADANNSLIDSWKKPGYTLIDGNKIFTGDVYVDTAVIRGEAVTLLRAQTGGSATTFNDTIIQSFNYDHGADSNVPVLFTFGALLTDSPGSGGASDTPGGISLEIDGVSRYSVTVPGNSAPANGAVLITLSPGNHTAVLKYTGKWNFNGGARKGYLTALGGKR